ncbi:MAG: hypothetical protein ACI85U_001074 [Candidatus Promineifilaceae bacterium]|jgi:hypothetical protein
MINQAQARTAGIVGMIGAVLWAIVNILEVRFELFPPNGSGPLYVTNQIMALIALAAIAYGYLGILWGNGVAGRFGKTAVWLFVIGNGLIIVGSLMALLVRSDDSLIFLVFPIGGLLMDLGALGTGIAVVRDKQWGGWQRWMPLLYATYLWLAIEIPFIMGAFGEGGPVGMVEIIQDIGLFLVGLAVFTWVKARSAVVPQPA